MNVLGTFSLMGKSAVVSGGGGLLGRQIVEALAEAGAQTFVTSRQADKVLEFAAAQRALGRNVVGLELDQSDEASVDALRDAVLGQAGAIDILVNNAVLRPMTEGYRDSAASFAASMAVNATGLFLVTRSLGDAMAAGGGGSIINIGSIQGMVAPDSTLYEGTAMHGFYPDYFFHKGGMINFTRFTASYYGARAVRCNCIAAGGYFSGQDPAFVERYSARTLLGRMAGDDDMKGIVVFLASDASRYVTGTNIPVDGGYTAK